MSFNARTIGILFRTEFRMVLRDRRVLLTAILLPVLLMPLVFAGSRWTFKRREARLREAAYRYAVASGDADFVRSFLSADPGMRAKAESDRDGVKISDMVTNGAVQTGFKFTEVKSDNPWAALEDDKVDVVIEISSTATNVEPQLAQADPPVKASADLAKRSNGRKAESSAKKGQKVQDDDVEQTVPGVPIVRIVFRADRDLSSTAAGKVGDAFREGRRRTRADLLRQHRFPVGPGQVARITQTDVASKGQVAGLALGRSLTLLLLFLILTSGAVVAMDSIAGEKERGTLETLLTTSAGHTDVIVAKLLVILTVALIITLVQSANLLLYVGLKLMPIPANFAASISAPIVILLFVLFLPVACLAGSVLLLISGYAKSYKEAQMYFFPVFLLGLVPALVPLLPGLSLESIVVLLPIANIALCARDILIGNFDWPLIFLSWVVTLAAAGWTTSLTIRSLSNERLITAAETEPRQNAGRDVLFPRHVLQWFAVLWALLLIVNNYLEKADLRLQILINLVVLFFGASCLMMRYYRLNIRKTLSLHQPRPAVWVGVATGVPSGLIAASGLFKLVNHFIPISSKLMQQFDEAVVSPGVGFLQLLFFVSVLPGIFEEITFRGLLLHGLRQRFRPALTVLLVGIIFGLFHVALFRFAPTALLGIILTAITMLTGSIFPAMLWHALSNAASLLAFKLQLPLTELDPVSYVLATLILALSFWIIWRNRAVIRGDSGCPIQVESVAVP